jgi:cell division septation protein DedD
MRIVGRNKKGQKILITVPDLDDPAVIMEAARAAQSATRMAALSTVNQASADGSGDGEGSSPGSTPTPTPTPTATSTPTPTATSTPTPTPTATPTPTPTPTATPTATPSAPTATPTPTPTITPTPDPDSIRAQLTTSVSSYDSATVGNWVKVTQTEYNRVAANVTGATKKGNSDAQVNTRAGATSVSTYWVSYGTIGSPSFQIDTGEYVIALISEAWNQSTGQTTLGYTTTFNGNTITQIGGNTAGTSTGGNRDYYVRKAPTDAATETRYPVMKMSVSPNAVPGWSGYYTTNNGSTWTPLSNFPVNASKIQIITTSTKTW